MAAGGSFLTSEEYREEERRRSYDAPVCEPDRPGLRKQRRDLDVPDCKTDQNAISTCFEPLFMSCLCGAADLVPAKCNHYTNKRQESSANGSPN